LGQTTLMESAETRPAIFADPSVVIQKLLQGFHILVVNLFNIIGAKMTLFHG
jgi:hypothetical protein